MTSWDGSRLQAAFNVDLHGAEFSVEAGGVSVPAAARAVAESLQASIAHHLDRSPDRVLNDLEVSLGEGPHVVALVRSAHEAASLGEAGAGVLATALVGAPDGIVLAYRAGVAHHVKHLAAGREVGVPVLCEAIRAQAASRLLPGCQDVADAADVVPVAPAVPVVRALLMGGGCDGATVREVNRVLGGTVVVHWTIVDILGVDLAEWADAGDHVAHVTQDMYTYDGGHNFHVVAALGCLFDPAKGAAERLLDVASSALAPRGQFVFCQSKAMASSPAFPDGAGPAVASAATRMLVGSGGDPALAQETTVHEGPHTQTWTHVACVACAPMHCEGGGSGASAREPPQGGVITGTVYVLVAVDETGAATAAYVGSTRQSLRDRGGATGRGWGLGREEHPAGTAVYAIPLIKLGGSGSATVTFLSEVLETVAIQQLGRIHGVTSFNRRTIATSGGPFSLSGSEQSRGGG
jgi:hypothetical protein